MKPTEEALSPEAVATLEEQGRKMLVEIHALSGLIESNCAAPELFLPMVARQLKTVHTGEAEFAVFAVDSRGEIRQGPRGAMTAKDLAEEIRKDPGFYEIGWTRKQTQTPGTTTGREMRKWQ